MAQGRDILLEIDWQGAAQVRKLMPQAISLFILPPSIAELRKRLVGRGTDSAEVIEKRMASAQAEISHALEANYLVVNDDFDTATADLLAISRARRLQMDVQAVRQVCLLQDLLNSAA
jgi:guanylate kinase